VAFENQYDNMIFELTDSAEGEGANPEAVSVSLYHGAIPADRRSETRVTRSKGGVYSLSMSKMEFRPFLEEGKVQDFIFGVQCGPAAVSFTAYLRFVVADLPFDGSELLGQVCPDDIILHTIDVSQNLTRIAIDAALSETGLDANGANGHNAQGPNEHSNEGGHDRRRTDSGELPIAPAEIHIALDVIKFAGDMQIMLRFDKAPQDLTPPYTVIRTSASRELIPICNVQSYFTDASQGATPPQFFIGVFGGEACASYSLRIRRFSGICREEDHPTERAFDSGAAIALPVNTFMRGSCKPHSRHSPYVVSLPVRTMTTNNLAVEVHDLNDDDNPHSLSMVVYRGAGTHEQLAVRLASDNIANEQVYSAGFDYITLSNHYCDAVRQNNESNDAITGCATSSKISEMSIVVKCGAKAVLFQVIARLSPLELPQNAIGVGVPLSSEVCPKQWAFHQKRVTLQTKRGDTIRNMRFDINVNSGDIYYAMVRWHFPPGFAACNGDELIMTGKRSGSLMACGVEGAINSGEGGNGTATAYIGLFGGHSCAVYTVRSVPMTSSRSQCTAKGMGLMTGCGG